MSKVITLRIGSKGDAVRTLQRLLGVKPNDGVFGPQTERILKDYQLSHGLVPDGIAGPVTWNILLREDNGGLTVQKACISTHITKSPDRTIQYIAIHYTAGSSSKKGSALATRSVFIQRSASADYVVDDESIVQINPDIRNYYCWSVGDKKNPYSNGGKLYGIATNRNTVSIEICSNLKKGANAAAANHIGWYFTEKSIGNAITLVRHLMRLYGIPKERVVRHYDVSGKLCPGIVGWNDGPLYAADGSSVNDKNDSSEWQKFKARI